eukprot:4881180-Prymnesium_polylepis.1
MRGTPEFRHQKVRTPSPRRAPSPVTRALVFASSVFRAYGFTAVLSLAGHDAAMQWSRHKCSHTSERGLTVTQYHQRKALSRA